jgi:endonuclease/exonuclease/phosphatase family metal-dependent hydrolase
MIKKTTFLIILLSLTGLFSLCYSQEINVITYNIRFDNPEDGENRWDLRKENLVQLLRDYDPDIFGIQEGLLHQVMFIDSAMTGYSYIGQGRDDGKNAGEFCALFYKESALTLIRQGIFWLSETPQIPSIGWDAAFKRICVYGFFEYKKTRHRFLVCNTHLDHKGVLAREKSIEMIIARVAEINAEHLPVILMGDFNLEPGSKALSQVMNDFNDSRSVCSGEISGPAGTFNAFRFDLPVTQRIDYIFISKGKSEIIKYVVISDSEDGLYPSDHLPVYVTVRLK